MNISTGNTFDSEPQGRRFGCLHIAIFLLVAVIATAGVTYWIVRTYVFPSEFKPVTLSEKEERALDDKLEQLDPLHKSNKRQEENKGYRDRDAKSDTLKPERYREEGASREITLSEREVNALLAKNTDLARKLVIDLSDNLISAKLLVPVDEDFPILGGQILKVRAGLEMAYQAGKPIVVLKGISVMGVPIPNAWLGGIKNIDLVREFSAGEGFWKAFAAGVEDLRVEEGHLKIKLKE